ncbi:MAG: flagellar hook-basal body complex protein [Eubacterium sp.]|nr:flagellar hook-basal body complex protein [Eubacterium sp.]MCM1304896.1 flagellar hook-basal body complex protein [Butyrivibrio sp.]MCM1343338.1 flagellar hook-basal body complex protein [Muribaculaceae bacterium]MCM1410104.1 flagellar hook-basal body complex protein [Lachnospiraceae bacterium]
MMRSLFSGVAGLKTHQTKMDVIGNNIANVNTVGYKGSSMVFADLMSQTTQKASGPNAATGTGGTNARQIGLGVKGGAININITGQGSAQSTGNPFDIMIEGENFFVVNNGSENLFTRDGSFYVDAAGNLAMTSTGYNVMGWQVDPETMDIRQDKVSALRIMSTANLTYPAEATSQANMAGILDKNDKDATSSNGKTVHLQFFDALGYSYTAKFAFKKSNPQAAATDGTVPAQDLYSLELVDVQDSKGNSVELPEGVTKDDLFGDVGTIQHKAGKVSFDATNYEWAGAVLRKKGVTGTDGVIVDITTLMAGGKINTNRGAAATVNGKTDATVQDGLDAVAKAYGFEGSTEEFLNTLCSVTNTTVANSTPEEMSIATMMENLAASPTTPNAWNVLPTYPGATTETNTTFDTVGRMYTGVAIHFNAHNGEFYGVNGQPTVSTQTLRFSRMGGNFSDVTIDFSQLSEPDNKGTSTAGATSGDYDGLGAGRRIGKMIGVSIQQNGMIYASYDNGMTKLLGQIASASFPNASGLEKHGDNMYSATLNSGEFDGIGVDITAGGGKMTTGLLEMSNVDLSSEFTEMITTQRGFQANSRIITVSDTLLEELTNLKR